MISIKTATAPPTPALNEIERTSLVAQEVTQTLEKYFDGPIIYHKLMWEIDYYLKRKALFMSDGVKAKAADLLGMRRSTYCMSLIAKCISVGDLENEVK